MFHMEQRKKFLTLYNYELFLTYKHILKSQDLLNLKWIKFMWLEADCYNNIKRKNNLRGVFLKHLIFGAIFQKIVFHSLLVKHVVCFKIVFYVLKYKTMFLIIIMERVFNDSSYHQTYAENLRIMRINYQSFPCSIQL